MLLTYVVLLLSGFFKLFSLLKGHRQFCEMSILFREMASKLRPFGQLFLSIVGVMALLAYVLGAENHFSMYWDGAADGITPTAADWSWGREAQTAWLGFVVYFVLNLIIVLFVLNFLLAQVLQSYDETMSRMDVLMLNEIAQLNVQSAILIDRFSVRAFSSKKPVQSFYMQANIPEENESEAYRGFVKTVQTTVKDSGQALQGQLEHLSNRLESQNDQMAGELKQIKATIAKLANMMKKP